MNILALVAICVAPSISASDGTLVVLRDSNVIVKEYTQSSWTHIGIILKTGGRTWVFEASPGAVRKVPLTEFFREATPSRFTGNRQSPLVYFLPPKTPFPPAELLAMKKFAAQQIGRRYSVKGILRGRSAEGMNCAQFVAATLQQTGRVRFSETFTQTPASVLQHTRSLYVAMIPVRMPGEGIETGWLESADRTLRGTAEWWNWSTWEALHYWRD